jgi:hypothetical protein
MLAALITGKDTVVLTEFPDPTPAPEGVVVDVSFCGICGTDVHAYQSGRPYNPAICGHEWSGTVSAVGRDVSSFTEGDRVVVAAAPSCGTLHGMSSWTERPLRGDVPLGARARSARPAARRVRAPHRRGRSESRQDRSGAHRRTGRAGRADHGCVPRRAHQRDCGSATSR